MQIWAKFTAAYRQWQDRQTPAVTLAGLSWLSQHPLPSASRSSHEYMYQLYNSLKQTFILQSNGHC